MNDKTEKLIISLTDVLQNSKFLLLQGNSGVGKTYLAKLIANRVGNAENYFLKNNSQKQEKPEIEILPFHMSLGYEDVINGIECETINGAISFEYRNKIFLSMLKSARDDYFNDVNRKHILILDDIQRGNILDIMGEVFTALQPEKEKPYEIKLNYGDRFIVTPNFYVIATMNVSDSLPDTMDKSVLAHFYTYELHSDISYIAEINEDNIVRDLYDKTQNIINKNLDYQFLTNPYERNKYVIGHGYFQQLSCERRVRYQVIPLLKQYIAEGIVDSRAYLEIDGLAELCNNKITSNEEIINNDRIKNYVNGVTQTQFVEEGKTNKPLLNLVSRIKEQGIISDKDIENYILFNDKIMYLCPEGSSYFGTLVVDENGLKNICRPKSNRPKYDPKVYLKIENQNFYFIRGMQPREFTLNVEEIPKNETYKLKSESTSPVGVLFRITMKYYELLMQRYKKYFEVYSQEDYLRLLNYTENEWNSFVQEFKKINDFVSDKRAVVSSKYQSELKIARELFKEKKNLLVKIKADKSSSEADIQKVDEDYKKADENKKNIDHIVAAEQADINEEGNKKLRELISKLYILWTDKDKEIVENIFLKGAYVIMGENIYREYIESMNALGINQMILQGPPGTSKTYSTKEFLKFMSKGIDNDELCTEEELNMMQITDYQNENYCEWIKKGQQPQIAWDIVQFHPSYGYEDFIRGIEVSTKDSGENPTRKFISYDTVNKTLGKIADLALKAKEANFNTKFFLVVDEINRANLATVFGELIYGLEYRNESVSTPYTVGKSNKVALPDNLYIIGTMNTADKSIGGIDYAIRRRFLFFSLLPDARSIEKFKVENGEKQIEVNKKACALFNVISKVFDENLNPEYYIEDVKIGHTYFLVSSEEQLFKKFLYQIIPILREYYKDGLFNFEVHYSEDGINGLINCINGEISTSSSIDIIRKIFNTLVIS